MRLYQKMIEIYQEKIKLKKLVYKKKIQQVEVGLNEKKNDTYTYILFFYWKPIA